MPTGDFPIGYPSSFSVMSTASIPNAWIPVTTTTGGTTTVTYPMTSTAPNTIGYTAPYPHTNYPYQSGGVVWASTGTQFQVEPEWTHRIWFNDHWTYYMQTSNVAEDILMNKRKIKQSCLLR